MAKVGKNALDRRIADPHEELLASITEHANQIYGRLMLTGIVDPEPRHFVLMGIALKLAREVNGLPPLPRDVVVGTFLWLVPPAER